MSPEQLFFSWVIGWPLLGVLLGLAGRRWALVRWPLSVVAALYATVVFVIFITHGGPEQGAFAVIVVVAVTVFSFGPVVSIFTGTRTWTLVATVLLLLLLVYFVVGLLLWFPVAAGLIAASIAGPPSPRKPSVAAHHDRLDALE